MSLIIARAQRPAATNAGAAIDHVIAYLHEAVAHLHQSLVHGRTLPGRTVAPSVALAQQPVSDHRCFNWETGHDCTHLARVLGLSAFGQEPRNDRPFPKQIHHH
jgi:hypothetical protein